jgi:HD-GYP domain-containing protein (c-di-GMP phosphodiesterase class II)
MDRRERVALVASAIAYLIAAVAIAAFLPSHRDFDPVLLLGLLFGYVAISRVRFEFGNYYVAPEQLVLVPMFLLAPLPWVPLLVALGGAIGLIPESLRGQWGRDRWIGAIADSWPAIPPVLVIAAFAPGLPTIGHWPIYLLALFAGLVADFTQTVLREVVLDKVPMRTFVADWIGTSRVDLILAPMAFAASVAAVHAPVLLALVVALLAWLLNNFAEDRRERYAAALELNRAYRGTVMLLSDVLEFDDQYTASHSRSVVELVNAVAEEMGIDQSTHRELEFAAMLHDIGKIAIPKAILNKPSSLTDDEYRIMMNHTIEGQFMLDRVGGLLGRVGEIVRSCHERWDGAGYPDGLAGEAIPLTARIVFACDAYNAMTTDRAYRKAMSTEAAVDELIANAGSQFDPVVVQALAVVLEKGEPVLTSTDEIRAVLATRPTPQRASVAI